MPPQPITRIKPGIKHRLFFDTLDERSAVAQAMAECIGKWSVVDTYLGYIFISLLQSNEGQGAELYASFESAKAKTNAIKALAVASLSEAENALVTRLLKYVASQQKVRDKLAHWLIGTSEQLPDSLILVDPKEAWLMVGLSKQDFREGMARPEPNRLFGRSVPPEKVFAYSLRSLQADRDVFFELSILLIKFSQLVSSTLQNPTRQQLFDELDRDARLAGHKGPTQTAAQSNP